MLKYSLNDFTVLTRVSSSKFVQKGMLVLNENVGNALLLHMKPCHLLLKGDRSHEIFVTGDDDKNSIILYALPKITTPLARLRIRDFDRHFPILGKLVNKQFIE